MEFSDLIKDLFGGHISGTSLDEQVLEKLRELNRPIDEPLSSANDTSYGMGV